MGLLKADEKLSDGVRNRLHTVFDVDDPTGKLQAAWEVIEQLRVLVRSGFLAGAAAAKEKLQLMV